MEQDVEYSLTICATEDISSADEFQLVYDLGQGSETDLSGVVATVDNTHCALFNLPNGDYENLSTEEHEYDFYAWTSENENNKFHGTALLDISAGKYIQSM